MPQTSHNKNGPSLSVKQHMSPDIFDTFREESCLFCLHQIGWSRSQLQYATAMVRSRRYFFLQRALVPWAYALPRAQLQ